MVHDTLVVRATDVDRATIRNLIQLYLYDMTLEEPFAVGRDGLFDYEFFDQFWQWPYLILRSGELAGFAFVVKGSPISEAPDRWFMAEFFVLRAHRRKGVGKAAFGTLLGEHPGKWQIGVMAKNKNSKAFWTATIAEPFSLKRHDFEGDSWLLYDFDSRP